MSTYLHTLDDEPREPLPRTVSPRHDSESQKQRNAARREIEYRRDMRDVADPLYEEARHAP